jgi:hypothetical protein
MFRLRQGNTTSSSRRSRGAPYPQPRRMRLSGSSPPTRRCSVSGPRTQLTASAVPADVGVLCARTGRRGGWHRPPRQRGGTSAAGKSPDAAEPVLPADAGVFRFPGWRCGRIPRPPRRRGGASTARTARRVKSGPPRRRGGASKATMPSRMPRTSSPPTRECFMAHRHPVADARALPADAGVLRAVRSARAPGTRPPRQRGGASFSRRGVSIFLLSSPPTRGCSHRGVLVERVGHVLPANAGVFRPTPCSAGAAGSAPRRPAGVLRTSRPPPRRPGRPPRQRGGASGIMPVRMWIEQFSPPTRGCFAQALRRLLRSDVLPADAAVLRRRRRHRTTASRPPRRRGGASAARARFVVEAGSSPPTRGCFDADRVARPVRPVLPADAGVLRRSTPSSSPSSSLPRRRGGASTVIGHLEWQPGSSPPMRGCSAPADHHHGGPATLPADAGVLRGIWRSSDAGSSPPRRRGGASTRRWPTTAARVLPADAGVLRRQRCRSGCRPVLPANAG